MCWRRAPLDLLAALVPLLTVAANAWWLLQLPDTYVIGAIGLYTVLAAFIIYTLPKYLPAPGLGHANRVTLGRATLVVPVAALTFLPVAPIDATAWWITGVSTLVCIEPIIPTIVGATALALLIYSFGIDIRWLVRKAHMSLAT